MAKCTLPEEQIIEGLRDPQQRDATMRCIYMDDTIRQDFRNYVGASRLIFLKNLIFVTKLKQEEIPEAYHDTLIKFEDRIRSNKYVLGNWRGFFKQCAKEVWRDYNRKGQKAIDAVREPQDYDTSINPISEEDTQKEKLVQMEQMFFSLGETGRMGWEIYSLAREGYGYAEMAQQLNVAEATLRQRKTACDRRFRKVYNIELPSITRLRD